MQKTNTSIICISQSYFDTLKIIRLNFNYFESFKCCNPKEIDRVRPTHGFELKKETFMNAFNEATKNRGVLLIDSKTNDESFKYRKNLDIRLVEFVYTK